MSSLDKEFCFGRRLLSHLLRWPDDNNTRVTKTPSLRLLSSVISSFTVSTSHWDMGGCQCPVRGQGRHSTLRGDWTCVCFRLKSIHDAEETAGNQRQEKKWNKGLKKRASLCERQRTRGRQSGGADGQMRSETSGLGPGSWDGGVTSWQEGGLRCVVFPVASQACVLLHAGAVQPVWLKYFYSYVLLPCETIRNVTVMLLW